MTIQNLNYPFLNDKDYNFVFSDINNIPLNITGYVIYLTIKNLPTDSDPGLLQKKVTIHTDPVNGKSKVKITKSDGLLVGSFFYDITLIDNTGNKVTPVSGKINVQQIFTFAQT